MFSKSTSQLDSSRLLILSLTTGKIVGFFRSRVFLKSPSNHNICNLVPLIISISYFDSFSYTSQKQRVFSVKNYRIFPPLLHLLRPAFFLLLLMLLLFLLLFLLLLLQQFLLLQLLLFLLLLLLLLFFLLLLLLVVQLCKHLYKST